MKKEPKTVQAIDRTVGILDLLAQHPAGISLSEIATRIGLAPQTVQSLIRTLQVHKLAVQPSRGAPYFLGPKVHYLSRGWLESDGRAVVARDPMLRLSQEMREYVILAEYRGHSLIPLIEIRSDQALSASSGPWRKDDWYRMATGQLLIAYLPEQDRDRVLAEIPEEETTRIRSKLPKILKEHCVVCRQEKSDDISAIAVPIGDDPETMLALGAAIPAVRFSASYEQKILKALRATAAEIAALV